MNANEIRTIYGPAYAASYNDKFLFTDIRRADTEQDIATIRRLLDGHRSWLDVACGTGFFLSRFPDVERAGLDLSPDMLAVARRANPGVPLYEGTYLDPWPEWERRWDLVSCMWYAYGLVSSIAEIERLIANMARWTSPRGACFMPVCDIEGMCGKIPYEVATPWPGRLYVSSVTWTYVEPTGEAHRDVIAPQMEYLQEMFARYFHRTEVISYPPAVPGWELSQRSLVAREPR
jgi:SAM-dependent methyltransferase